MTISGNFVDGYVQTKVGLLDRRIFIDPEIYAKELEQVFGRAWLFVGHETQVPKPNDFMANYMAEDPVLVTRDAKGKLHTFLNMCRHRGNRICRADHGNAPSFMCTYHGWTFSTDGKLVGVPGYKEAYFEELDRSQWGLVEASCDTYKGFIFANWDRQAPSLPNYLSNKKSEIDFMAERPTGEAEVIGGVHRWVMGHNWKFAADNFGSDGYHHPITHGSIRNATVDGKLYNRSVAERLEFRDPLDNMPAGPLRNYYKAHAEFLKKRMGGSLDGQNQILGSVFTVFPNVSFNCSRYAVRVWHPRGPDKTEVWAYCLVDKSAPQDVKNAMRNHITQTFGPSGNLEQDDASNWIQSTQTAKGFISPKYVQNLQLGLNHEEDASVNETGQRGLYHRWAKLMDAPSWSAIPDWDQIVTSPSSSVRKTHVTVRQVSN